MRLLPQDLLNLAQQVFIKAGAPAEVALSVAQALAKAELQGLSSHGFSRIPFYADQVKSGKIKANNRPEISRPAQGVLLVDAQNGFAFPAIEAGLREGEPVAKELGICGLAITNSHHCGVLGIYARQIAENGLISLIFSNTPAAMAPWGGSKASFGTNPIAFGCPRKKGYPVVIDLSLSKVARGKVMTAKNQSQPIPEGWALDAEGNPTTDPDKALKGTMIPFGDAKGAALALMVEILCATLTGANYAFEASSFFEAEGPAPGIGQNFILINPLAYNPDFSAKLEILLNHISTQPGARIPGIKRMDLQEKNKLEGVEISDKLYNDLLERSK